LPLLLILRLRLELQLVGLRTIQCKFRRKNLNLLNPPNAVSDGTETNFTLDFFVILQIT
jgi:hypothetical protein